ncbi:MAG: type I-B CRISPR-associated protein Cas5 [Candidatus Aminicenantes bacterium]|nr:MAG: type I-B CRISPR-associated protein Cas5 [Candidatus Aminicenantes bacterium]
MKTVCFDLWGDWGHFKKFYTTASPLTFHVPPITAVKGIIGAILGLSNKPDAPSFYLDELKGVSIAVQIIKPIKTYRMGINWIETKKAKYLARIPSEKGRYQTIIEVLKEPAFRICVVSELAEKEQLLDQLEKKLISHQSVYTPYLGISEFLANFSYYRTFHAQRRISQDYVEIESIVPLDVVESEEENFLKIEPGKVYQRDRIPVSMNKERMVTKYTAVLYEMNTYSLKLKCKEFWELENGPKICFFHD